MTLLYISGFFLLVQIATAGNFYQQLHSIKHQHQAQAHAQRLGHVEDFLAGSLPASSQLSTATPIFLSAVSAATSPSFQIYTHDTLPISPAPPAACASALTAPVSCNYTVQYMSYPFDQDSLAAMCKNECTFSLQSYRSGVASACAGYELPGPNNSTYAATLAVDTIASPYTVQCRQDAATGQFCSAVLSTFTTSDPSQGILGYPQTELCSDCLLGTLNATLSSGLSFSDALYTTLQSALRICGSSFNSYNVTPPLSTSTYTPGPKTSSGSNLTSSPICSLTGRIVTVPFSTDCDAIATQFSVTPTDILENNPIIRPVNCTSSGIGSGAQLCLPQSCKLYTMQADQNCQDVVDDVNHNGLSDQNITVAQLQSFNPSLSVMCNTIAVGDDKIVCITPHGGFPHIGNDGGDAVPTATPTAQEPPPGPTVNGTTSDCGRWYLVQKNDFCQQVALNNSVTLDDFLKMNPEVNVNCTNLWAGYNYCVAPYPPFASISAAPIFTANSTAGQLVTVPLTTVTTTTPLPNLPSYTGIPAPTNIAPGTITNGCGYYYVVNEGDNCTFVEEFFDMSEADFLNYNDNPSNPCPSLTAGSAVCVQVLNATDALPPRPTNAAQGSAPSGCAKWYTIQSGDGCDVVEQQFGLTATEFFALNPELNVQCTNLALDEAYCVKAPPSTTTSSTPTGPTAAPTPSNVISGTDTKDCAKYDTVISGDSCPQIEGRNDISDSLFRALNPEINSQCTNLQLGGAYCVKAIEGFTPTATGTSSTPTQTAGPPSNLAAGSWTNCTTYYTIVSGDNCQAVDTTFNIAFSDFLLWNSEVNAACTNIQLGAAYCVKGSDACPKIYTVQSGDFCSLIESKVGLTDAQLHSVNPWIDANCDLQPGQNLCAALH